MTEDEFHQSRQMLAYWQGSLLLAPTGTEMGHRQWLLELFGAIEGSHILRHCIRGFVRENVLALYTVDRETGNQFSQFMPPEHMWKIYCLLGKPPQVNIIWRGMLPDTKGELWRPKTDITPADLERRLAIKAASPPT